MLQAGLPRVASLSARAPESARTGAASADDGSDYDEGDTPRAMSTSMLEALSPKDVLGVPEQDGV